MIRCLVPPSSSVMVICDELLAELRRVKVEFCEIVSMIANPLLEEVWV